MPVNSSTGFWEFTAEGYEVGNGGAVAASHIAIADTGTTLLFVPPQIAEAYYAQVSGAQNNALAGGYTYPCSTVMPNYTAVIGGRAAVVPGTLLTYAPIDGNTIETAKTCFGGLQPTPSSLPFSIYGDIFLKSQFVVFDGGNKRLGLAAKPL